MSGVSAAEIEAWLLARLRARLGTQAEEVEAHLPFSYYGLESMDAVALAAELQEWLGVPVSPSLAWDYPTAHAVAAHLAGDQPNERSGPAGDAAAQAVAGLLAAPEEPSSDANRGAP